MPKPAIWCAFIAGCPFSSATIEGDRTNAPLVPVLGFPGSPPVDATMQRSLTLLALAGAFVAAPAWTQTPADADEDGCWDPPPDCLAINTEWQGERFWSFGTNNCGGRVYAKFCNERNKNGDDCGAAGIPAEGGVSWASFDATGNTAWQWVGSNNGAKDWVCSGKVDGWHDDPVYADLAVPTVIFAADNDDDAGLAFCDDGCCIAVRTDEDDAEPLIGPIQGGIVCAESRYPNSNPSLRGTH